MNGSSSSKNNNATPAKALQELEFEETVTTPVTGIEGIQIRVRTNEDDLDLQVNDNSSSEEDEEEKEQRCRKYRKVSEREEDEKKRKAEIQIRMPPIQNDGAASTMTSMSQFQQDFERNLVFAEFIKGLVGKEVQSLGLKPSPKKSDDQKKNNRATGNVRKSPSNATIYKQALKQRLTPNKDDLNAMEINNQKDKSSLIIAEFLNDIRKNVPFVGTQKPKAVASTSADIGPVDEIFEQETNELVQREVENQNREQAKHAADDLILMAERNKAAIAGPLKGTMNSQSSIDSANYLSGFNGSDQVQRVVVYEDPDEKFQHSTCFLDDNNNDKAERGKWVELVKFLPKTDESRFDDEKKTELMSKNGLSFWVSSSKTNEQRIYNYAKWEQAFRNYASIYLKKNPHKAPEVLQYIQTINEASLSFQWNNVARYDCMFRKLMDEYPNRSWGKTYIHGYVTCMKNPLSNSNSNHRYHSQNNGQNNGNNSNNNNRSMKDNICWRYNKNKCGLGAACRFEHKCSFCGGNHIFYGCPKRTINKKDDKAKQNGSTSENKN